MVQGSTAWGTIRVGFSGHADFSAFAGFTSRNVGAVYLNFGLLAK